MLLSGSCVDQTDCVCMPCSCAFTCITSCTVTPVCTTCFLVVICLMQNHDGGVSGGAGGGDRGRLVALLVEMLIKQWKAEHGSLMMLLQSV